MIYEWQPIETAPRDGTTIILYSPLWEMSWGVCIGHFEQGPNAGVWITSEGDAAENDAGYDPNAEVDDPSDDEEFDSDNNMGPTIWFPLPEPPQGE